MADARPDPKELVERIDRLKKERNAVLLVHNYQLPEVQEIADFLGDSLGLSRQAASTDAEVIVFCGVHFMAETAAILSPNKTVLLPDPGAGCSLASMISAESLRKWKSEHPDALVVSYVNTSAEVKAESDYCCTSGNAEQVVRAIPEDREILFGPDRFLGAWVRERTGRKNMHIWGGFCHVHHRIREEDIRKVKEENPDGDLIVHPECGCVTAALSLADRIASTEGMVSHVAGSPKEKFMIATETGMLDRLQREYPSKKFLPVTREAFCEFMKLTNLEKIVFSLEEMEHRVTVPEEIRLRAKKAIDRMIAIG